MIYSAAGYCARYAQEVTDAVKNNIENRVQAATIKAGSKDDAVSLMLKFMQDTYKPSDGFENYLVCVSKVPEDWMSE